MKHFKNLKRIKNINTIYDFGEQLGKGAFGTVRKCTSKATGQDYAIKIVNRDSLKVNRRLPKMLLNEL
jgi:serine/threonine protein kinase